MIFSYIKLKHSFAKEREIDLFLLATLAITTAFEAFQHLSQLLWNYTIPTTYFNLSWIEIFIFLTELLGNSLSISWLVKGISVIFKMNGRPPHS